MPDNQEVVGSNHPKGFLLFSTLKSLSFIQVTRGGALLLIILKIYSFSQNKLHMLIISSKNSVTTFSCLEYLSNLIKMVVRLFISFKAFSS